MKRDDIIRAVSVAGFSIRGTFAHSASFRHQSGEPVQLIFDPVFDAMIDRAEPMDVGGIRSLWLRRPISSR